MSRHRTLHNPSDDLRLALCLVLAVWVPVILVVVFW